MKRITGLVFFLVCFSGVAKAERGDQYLLPKVGAMVIDLNEADPLLSAGIMYGLGLTNRISLEAEVNYGFSGGEYDVRGDAEGTVAESGDYRIWTAAGYGVYRWPIVETVYLKGKLGALYENVVRSSDFRAERTDDDFGAAGGVGIGFFMWRKFTLELEATVIDQDIIFYSVGTHIKF
jgi:hypothetical protein